MKCSLQFIDNNNNSTINVDISHDEGNEVLTVDKNKLFIYNQNAVLDLIKKT